MRKDDGREGERSAGRLKSPVAVAEHDLNGRIAVGSGIGDNNVGDAIAIEIGYRDVVLAPVQGRPGSISESAVAVPEQDGDRVPGGVGGGQVGDAVAVKVADGQSVRIRNLGGRTGRERSGAVAEEHSDALRRRVGDILVPVAVEISHHASGRGRAQDVGAEPSIGTLRIRVNGKADGARNTTESRCIAGIPGGQLMRAGGQQFRLQRCRSVHQRTDPEYRRAVVERDGVSRCQARGADGGIERYGRAERNGRADTAETGGGWVRALVAGHDRHRTLNRNYVAVLRRSAGNRVCDFDGGRWIPAGFRRCSGKNTSGAQRKAGRETGGRDHGPAVRAGAASSSQRRRAIRGIQRANRERGGGNRQARVLRAAGGDGLHVNSARGTGDAIHGNRKGISAGGQRGGNRNGRLCLHGGAWLETDTAGRDGDTVDSRTDGKGAGGKR